AAPTAGDVKSNPGFKHYCKFLKSTDRPRFMRELAALPGNEITEFIRIADPELTTRDLQILVTSLLAQAEQDITPERRQNIIRGNWGWSSNGNNCDKFFNIAQAMTNPITEMPNNRIRIAALRSIIDKLPDSWWAWQTIRMNCFNDLYSSAKFNIELYRGSWVLADMAQFRCIPIQPGQRQTIPNFGEMAPEASKQFAEWLKQQPRTFGIDYALTQIEQPRDTTALVGLLDRYRDRLGELQPGVLTSIVKGIRVMDQAGNLSNYREKYPKVAALIDAEMDGIDRELLDTAQNLTANEATHNGQLCNMLLAVVIKQMNTDPDKAEKVLAKLLKFYSYNRNYIAELTRRAANTPEAVKMLRRNAIEPAPFSPAKLGEIMAAELKKPGAATVGARYLAVLAMNKNPDDLDRLALLLQLPEAMTAVELDNVGKELAGDRFAQEFCRFRSDLLNGAALSRESIVWLNQSAKYAGNAKLGKPEQERFLKLLKSLPQDSAPPIRLFAVELAALNRRTGNDTEKARDEYLTLLTRILTRRGEPDAAAAIRSIPGLSATVEQALGSLPLMDSEDPDALRLLAVAADYYTTTGDTAKTDELKSYPELVNRDRLNKLEKSGLISREAAQTIRRLYPEK
ncbi:MAG: hypothetical protein PHI35_07185, partial [Victivallaceae bacterium]|nr:hypothetical protein [Victivallaceae bacterium]